MQSINFNEQGTGNGTGGNGTGVNNNVTNYSSNTLKQFSDNNSDINSTKGFNKKNGTSKIKRRVTNLKSPSPKINLKK